MKELFPGLKHVEGVECRSQNKGYEPMLINYEHESFVS